MFVSCVCCVLLQASATNRSLVQGSPTELFPPSSGLLRSVRWLKIDVLGLPIGPMFKNQAVFLERLDP